MSATSRILSRIVTFLACLAQPAVVGGSFGQAPEPTPAKSGSAFDRAVAKVEEIAGAGDFSKRSATWERRVESGSVHAVNVHFYAGNEYRLVLGHDIAAEVDIVVFDARRKLVPAAILRCEGAMVVHIMAARSGTYSVEVRTGGVQNATEATPVALALTYVYK